MNNTLVFPSPKRQTLVAFCVCFVICAIVFGACTILVKDIDDHNLDGRTLTISGVVTQVETNDCQDVTIQRDDGSKIVVNFIPFTGYLEDVNNTDEEQSIAFVQQLLGKTVSVDVPSNPWEDDNLWVLGATVDNVVIAESANVIAYKQSDNSVAYKILFAITVLLGVLACVFFILRVNTNPSKPYTLGEKYAEFFAERQPLSPSRKYSSLITLILFAIMLICAIILGFIPNENDDAMFIVAMIFLGMMVITLAYIIVFELIIARKKDIDFYVQNYPFDLNNVEHIKMNKKIKKQLADDLQKYKAEHPDTYGDGGNGFDVEFTPNGVNLYVEQDFYEEVLQHIPLSDDYRSPAPFDDPFEEPSQNDETPSTNGKTPVDMPTAGAVFSLYPNCDDDDNNCDGDKGNHDGNSTTSAVEQNANAMPFDGFDNANAPERKPLLSLSYKQLDFELVPYYFVGTAQQQKRPLMAVLKSRITDEVKKEATLPVFFVNDIHLLFDSNLLDTLAKFNVPVQGVEELLSNKKQLIMENRRKKK